jgi:hypothetical protein
VYILGLNLDIQYNNNQGNIMEFLKDLWLFMKERKKFWLAPVIIVLLILGILIVFGGSSAVAPFIYTLF